MFYEPNKTATEDCPEFAQWRNTPEWEIVLDRFRQNT